MTFFLEMRASSQHLSTSLVTYLVLSHGLRLDSLVGNGMRSLRTWMINESTITLTLFVKIHHSQNRTQSSVALNRGVHFDSMNRRPCLGSTAFTEELNVAMNGTEEQTDAQLQARDHETAALTTESARTIKTLMWV